MFKKNYVLIFAKYFIVYIGLVSIGFICSLFLDFSNWLGYTVLLLSLIIVGELFLRVTDYQFKKRFTDYHQNPNQSGATILYVFLFLYFIFAPQDFPSSLSELILLLTILLAVLLVKNFYAEKKRTLK